MSVLGKRQRWLACFLGGLLAAIALAFASITLNQTPVEAATSAWGNQAAVTSVGVRALADAARTHQEPNFYQ